MNQFLCALCVLCGLNLIAAPLQWTCDWPEAKSQTFSLYQGETATFEPTFRVNGRTVTNATIEAVWYQTNGMANAWWKLDGATFAPSNDVGAASYRFFVEAKASCDTIYRANGALRMLPSPGFTPNAIEPPIVTLDFSTIEVANAPYYDKAETEAKIVELAPAPGDYAAVSNAAMSASAAISSAATAATNYTDAATNTLSLALAHKVDDMTFGSATNQLVSKSGDTMTGNLTIQNGADGEFKVLKQAPSGLLGGDKETSYRLGEIYNNQGGRGVVLKLPTLEDGTLARVEDIPGETSNVVTKAYVEGLGISSEETDPTVPNWAKASTKPSYTASEVGATTAEDVYRIVAGTNVVLVVTNYNSATHAPAMKLQHLDPQSGEYVTYWDETRRHGLTLTNAMDYTDAAAAAELSRADAAYAPRAWSGTTSGLGSEAPGGVTWISTPETVIAGGYEYEKVITSSGAVWVLSSNGLTTGATTNSFFRVTATDGTELFAIEKTDSFLIGVNPDGITKVDNTVTIPVNVVADAHPYIRATTNLVNAVWTKEDEDGFTCPWATVSWSGTTGAYVATVTCSEPQAFFYFEYLVEGGAKIKNSATVEMTGGIYFNGYRYMPVVNGSKLEFIRQ